MSEEPFDAQQRKQQHNISLIYLNPSNKIRIEPTRERAEQCNRNGNTFSA